MFQNYNFNIDTQANLDDADFTSLPFAKNLALDHYNCSPSSLECSPQQEEEECEGFPMDTSFQQSCLIKHSQNILKASQEYLMSTSSVGQRGFDDNSIYTCFTSSSPAKGELLQIVKANQLFKPKQRKEFINELQQEGEICTLLVELMVLFNHHVFNEITFAVFKVWSSNYKKFKNNKPKKQSLFPSFSSFNGFDQQEQFFESGMTFNSSDFSTVSNASEEGIEKIVEELFNSKKLKYINLQEIRCLRGKRTDAKIYFSDFLKVISKAVFLSAEGIYEETTEINSFSEQELEDSKFSQIPRFTRLFSQTQEDGEQAIPTQESKKRIKLC